MLFRVCAAGFVRKHLLACLGAFRQKQLCWTRHLGSGECPGPGQSHDRTRTRLGDRWVAGYFLACLAAVLPTFAYGPHQGVYVFAVLLPLLGLLLLNSKRHREMRSKLIEIRHQRERILQSAKASRPRR
jgi:hypothetical protein